MGKRSAHNEAPEVSLPKRPRIANDSTTSLQPALTKTADEPSSPAEGDDADGDSAVSSPASTADAETPATAATTPRGKFPSDLKTLVCTWPECSRSFNRPSRLRDHLNSHLDYRPFKCSYDGCDKQYVESKHLKQHIKAAHTQELKYLCPRPGCGKSFVTGTRLRRHQAVHEGADRFRCVDCGQSFRKKETLHKHHRKEHLHVPAHECPHPGCTEAFDHKPRLRRHFDRAHGEIRFWCGECEGSTAEDGTIQRVGFVSQALLDAHVKKEHQDCIFCDYKSPTRWQLDLHVEVHHSGKSVEDRRVHECGHQGCGKKFTQSASLHSHIRSAHLGVRFVCGKVELSGPAFEGWSIDQGCGAGLVSRARLEDHVRFVHLGQTRPRMSLPEPRRNETDFIDDLCGATNDAKRNLACPSCPERFIRYHDLNLHLSRDHGDGKDEAKLMTQELLPIDPLFGQASLYEAAQEDGIFAAQMVYGPPADDWAMDEAAILLLTRDPPAEVD